MDAHVATWDSDYKAWIKWAVENDIDQDVISFISTFPENLYKVNEDDVRATPRSYERVSKVYKLYKEKKDEIPRNVFLNVIKGNVGRIIAEEFLGFIETEHSSLISFEEVFEGDNLSLDLINKIEKESHTKLYLSAINILKNLEEKIKRCLDIIKNSNTNDFELRPTEIGPLVRGQAYSKEFNQYYEVIGFIVDNNIYVDDNLKSKQKGFFAIYHSNCEIFKLG